MSTTANPHTVTWHLDGPGGHAWPTFTCTAPVGAECRLWCAVGCEEYCTNPDEHSLKDHGDCLATTWMEATDEGSELYAGPNTNPSNGPIVFRWDADSYVWQYDTAEAADTEAVAAVEDYGVSA